MPPAHEHVLGPDTAAWTATTVVAATVAVVVLLILCTKANRGANAVKVYAASSMPKGRLSVPVSAGLLVLARQLA